MILPPNASANASSSLGTTAGHRSHLVGPTCDRRLTGHQHVVSQDEHRATVGTVMIGPIRRPWQS
jgi:hypothetical protein